MSRRKRGFERGMPGAAVGVVAIALVGAAIANNIQTIGIVLLVVVTAIVGVILLAAWMKAAAKKQRLDYLTAKYSDATIVNNIYNGRYWQGQTAEQLTDSLGNPHGVDHKLLKTINRQIWKYNRRGVNRFALRITLDDGIVKTWDHKQ